MRSTRAYHNKNSLHAIKCVCVSHKMMTMTKTPSVCFIRTISFCHKKVHFNDRALFFNSCPTHFIDVLQKEHANKVQLWHVNSVPVRILFVSLNR